MDQPAKPLRETGGATGYGAGFRKEGFIWRINRGAFTMFCSQTFSMFVHVCVTFVCGFLKHQAEEYYIHTLTPRYK